MTAARSASVVEPVMVGGRVWGTSAIMAPNVTTIAASTAVATSVMASLRFARAGGVRPLDQHEITGLVGWRQDVDPVIGPVDDTTAVVSDADLGPALAEVEERVGVDDADLDPPGAS